MSDPSMYPLNWIKNQYSHCPDMMLNMTNARYTSELSGLFGALYAPVAMQQNNHSIGMLLSGFMNNAYNQANTELSMMFMGMPFLGGGMQMPTVASAAPWWSVGGAGAGAGTGTGNVSLTKPKAPEIMSEEDKKEFNAAVEKFENTVKDYTTLTKDDFSKLGIKQSDLDDIKTDYKTATTTKKITDCIDAYKAVFANISARRLENYLRNKTGFKNYKSIEESKKVEDLSKDNLENIVCGLNDADAKPDKKVAVKDGFKKLNDTVKTLSSEDIFAAEHYFMTRTVSETSLLENLITIDPKPKEAADREWLRKSINVVIGNMVEFAGKTEFTDYPAVAEAIDALKVAWNDGNSLTTMLASDGTDKQNVIDAYKGLYNAIRRAKAQMNDKENYKLINESNLPQTIKDLYLTPDGSDLKDAYKLNEKYVDPEFGKQEESKAEEEAET